MRKEIQIDRFVKLTATNGESFFANLSHVKLIHQASGKSTTLMFIDGKIQQAKEAMDEVIHLPRHPTRD